MRLKVFLTVLAWTILLGGWSFALVKFPDVRLFILIVPPVAALHLWARDKRKQNVFISIVVIVWLALFHYESVKTAFLEPLFQKSLPKTKFLFPPAGWIMYFNVGDQFGFYEVFGVKGKNVVPLDPHDIIRTRTIFFDNIHRGILGTAASPERARPFCRYLKGKFKDFDAFVVTGNFYPSITKEPYNRIQRVLYQCTE